MTTYRVRVIQVENAPTPRFTFIIIETKYSYDKNVRQSTEIQIYPNGERTAYRRMSDFKQPNWDSPAKASIAATELIKKLKEKSNVRSN